MKYAAAHRIQTISVRARYGPPNRSEARAPIGRDLGFGIWDSSKGGPEGPPLRSWAREERRRVERARLRLRGSFGGQVRCAREGHAAPPRCGRETRWVSGAARRE